MVLALPIVSSVITSCSSRTSAYNNSTVNNKLYIPDPLIQHNLDTCLTDNPDTISQNLEKPVAPKNHSMTRRSVSYREIYTRPNNFNKNPNKSRRRTGALFQPGRTNCNQRTIR